MTIEELDQTIATFKAHRMWMKLKTPAMPPTMKDVILQYQAALKKVRST